MVTNYHSHRKIYAAYNSTERKKIAIRGILYRIGYLDALADGWLAERWVGRRFIRSSLDQRGAWKNRVFVC